MHEKNDQWGDTALKNSIIEEQFMRALLIAIVWTIIVPMTSFCADQRPVFPNMSSVRFNIGAEFSSFNTSQSTNDNNALSQQFLFVSIATDFDICKHVTIIPEIEFGRANISKGDSITENIKNAQAIIGKIDFFVTTDKLNSIRNYNYYLKAGPGFIYTNDNRINQDVLFDIFIGPGIQVQNKQSKLYGSYVEIGYGYSERFDEHRHRFKSNFQLSFDKIALRPFIRIGLNSDLNKGADDIRVIYGAALPVENITTGITSFFK